MITTAAITWWMIALMVIGALCLVCVSVLLVLFIWGAALQLRLERRGFRHD